MPQLFTILDESGRTLLVRTQGDVQTPSFPTLGLLCSISTFSEAAGFSIQTFGTANVQIVYRRFDNHLMFVLATSNLLVPQHALQSLLQAVYEAVQLLLGAPLLALDNATQLDALRKKLRGLPLVDKLVEDDALVPCLMLPGPQVLGLPLKDRAALVSALTRVADAAGSRHAALISEGLYLAATPAWWQQLKPGEALLLQHITTHLEPEAQQVDMQIYLSLTRYQQPTRLLAVMLDQGVQLLLLVDQEVEAERLAPVIAQHAQKVEPIFRLSSIRFDMAAVVQHPPRAAVTLFWGQGRQGGGEGFNPLMSPTLRRQMNSPASGVGPAASLRSISLPREGSQSDALQLFFKASLDLVTTFLLGTSDMHTITTPDKGGSGQEEQLRAEARLRQQQALLKGQTQHQHQVKQRGSLDVLTSAGGEHGSVAGRLASTGQASQGAGSAWGGDLGLIDDEPLVVRGTAGGGGGATSRGPSVTSLGPQGEGAYFSTTAGASPVRAAQAAGTQTGHNTPRGGVSAAAQRLFQSFISLASLGSVTLGRGAGGAQEGGAGGEGALGHALREVHLVNGDGKRLVALLDSGHAAISVFMATSAEVTRLEAGEAARKLRSIFCMSYA